MRKVAIHRRGGYEQLRLEEHPSPPLGPTDVRIAVEAAGVNYADCVVRMGLYKSARDFVGWPITPGFEVAGTVAEVGDAVTDRREGDAVLGVTRFGGYASEVVVPATQVFDRPRGFTAQQAAGFPAVHLTAEYAIGVLARPSRGDAVLVHSAAGGVGLALVRLGKHMGCRVVGVVGASHKVEHAREAGAIAVIDTSAHDLWRAAERESPDGYAAIFDANGVSTLRQSYRHIAPTGRLVVYGFASMLPRADERMRWLRLAWDWLRTPRFDPFALTNENRSVMGFNLSYLFDHLGLLRTTMDKLLALADEGVLPPPPVTAYPLHEAASAHRALESGQTVGKLVLVP
jgi:NADPH:quinone reductase-like Zn-dependent oxidoreductase